MSQQCPARNAIYYYPFIFLRSSNHHSLELLIRREIINFSRNKNERKLIYNVRIILLYFSYKVMGHISPLPNKLHPTGIQTSSLLKLLWWVTVAALHQFLHFILQQHFTRYPNEFWFVSTWIFPINYVNHRSYHYPLIRTVREQIELAIKILIPSPIVGHILLNSSS